MSKKKRKINDSPPFGPFSGEAIPFRFDRIGARFNERNESSIALLIQSRTEFARAREAGTRADINLSVPQNDSQHDFRRSERGERERGGGKSPGKRVPRGRATRASEIRTGNTGHPTDILHNSIYVSRGVASDPRDR